MKNLWCSMLVFALLWLASGLSPFEGIGLGYGVVGGHKCTHPRTEIVECSPSSTGNGNCVLVVKFLEAGNPDERLDNGPDYIGEEMSTYTACDDAEGNCELLPQTPRITELCENVDPGGGGGGAPVDGPGA